MNYHEIDDIISFKKSLCIHHDALNYFFFEKFVVLKNNIFVIYFVFLNFKWTKILKRIEIQTKSITNKINKSTKKKFMINN